MIEVAVTAFDANGRSLAFAKARIRNYVEPAQSVQPWQYGDNESKRTCLWLKGLPALQPWVTVKPADVQQRVWLMPPGPERERERSRFFPGIARAMAEQWGYLGEDAR